MCLYCLAWFCLFSIKYCIQFLHSLISFTQINYLTSLIDENFKVLIKFLIYISIQNLHGKKF